MDFQLLGPLKIRSASTHTTLSSSRHRKLLAALLTEANRVVSVDRLVDILWNDNPPATARRQVQNCIGTLRTQLIKHRRQQYITCSSGGYAFEVDEGKVDLFTFRHLCRQAEKLSSNNQQAEAVKVLREALGLWHGTAFQGVGSDALMPEATRLEEIRVQAVEQLVDLEFNLENHSGVIADLTAWIQVYPYHEGLHYRLAQGLQHTSRAAEALQVIHDLKHRLTEELGIPAAPPIHSLEQQLIGARTASTFAPPGAHYRAVQRFQRALADLADAAMLLMSFSQQQSGPYPGSAIPELTELNLRKAS